MRAGMLFRLLLLAAVTFILVPACTPPRPATPEISTYYMASVIGYLRDSPGYDGLLLGQLYKGDQVEKLDRKETGWWRVRSARTGQTGWIQGELLGPDPVALVHFYITRTVALRECAGEACPSLQLLYRGDQVQKLEENEGGWWRVLVERSRTLGWVPAAATADRLEEAAVKPPQPYYYVGVKALRLRRQPALAAEVVKTLGFNDQVEELEINPSGWVKVRQPATGAVGWVMGRYLEALPLKALRPAPRQKKPAAPQSEPPGPKGTEPPELDVM